MSSVMNLLIAYALMFGSEATSWDKLYNLFAGNDEKFAGTDTMVDESEDIQTEAEMYGRPYDEYMNYKTPYTTAYPEPVPVQMSGVGDATYGIDAANALMAQKRSRDKKAMDGFVTKTANYYRYHFDSELDKAENKPWWGAYDY